MKALVLPGTKWQEKLVEELKRRDIKVALVDPNPNAPCVKYADFLLSADIFDSKKVIDFACNLDIGAVISDECDIAMPVVADISTRLGLSSLSIESAALYTDKFLMREFCKENGINYPEYKLCYNLSEAEEFFSNLGRSMIIKPIDCNASKGVFKIESVKELRELFDESLKFSRIEKAVLCERYISGTEFTIDGIKTPSAHYTLAISEKKHFNHNINIASELLFRHYNEAYNYDELKKVNDKFVLNSPLDYGLTHAEYKYENGVFYLIEIAARGGGNMISSVIAPFMSGKDTYNYLINASFGNIGEESFNIEDCYFERAAVLKFFETPHSGGRVIKIDGLDYLENSENVKEYKFNFEIGEVIEDAVSDSARIGFYIACADTYDELLITMNEIEQKVKIVVEEQEDERKDN